MKTNDIFPSKYLKAEDIEGDTPVTIKAVTIETLTSREKGEEQKPIIFFNELPKGVVMNKTNWGILAKQYGDESDNWIGQSAVLTKVTVEAFGEVVDALRFKEVKSNKPSEIVTAYWTKVSAMKLTREEGQAHLEQFGGNFTKALDGLTSPFN